LPKAAQKGSVTQMDVAAGVWGGTLYFYTGGRIIRPLKMKQLPLIVGYTGIKADTVTLVNQVAAQARKYPGVINGVYDLMEQIVKHAKPAVLKQEWETVGELMNLNHGLLESLGVSIDKLSQMIYAARNNGAYGAKLSGGGGGDCMIAFIPENVRQNVEKGIEKAGGQIIPVKAHAEGVRIEK
jgi:mevalonate kinase